MAGVRLRPARFEELGALEELQRRASLALDEYREALLAHPDAIALPAGHVERGEIIVAELGDRLAGFAVVCGDHRAAELDGLFVEPELWRQGIGTALVDAAIGLARNRGLSLMTVVAGPNAKEFYRRCGFTVEGETETRFGSALRMSR